MSTSNCNLMHHDVKASWQHERLHIDRTVLCPLDPNPPEKHNLTHSLRKSSWSRRVSGYLERHTSKLSAQATGSKAVTLYFILLSILGSQCQAAGECALDQLYLYHILYLLWLESTSAQVLPVPASTSSAMPAPRINEWLHCMKLLSRSLEAVRCILHL